MVNEESLDRRMFSALRLVAAAMVAVAVLIVAYHP
jgi:hypothetical protein